MIVHLVAALIALGLGQGLRQVMAQAVEDFRAGRIEQSVAGFDRLADADNTDQDQGRR